MLMPLSSLLLAFTVGAVPLAIEINSTNFMGLTENSVPMGQYHVKSANEQHLGGMVSGVSQNALVYYPEEKGIYPLIAFAHGIASGGVATQANYGRILSNIASFGFVVVAMDVCALDCDIDLYARDQLHIIDAVKTSSNPIFKMANHSVAGLAGHSWGGISTVEAAKLGEGKAKAAFALHPCPCQSAFSTKLAPCKKYDIKIPVAFFTGTLDTICIPTGVKDYYDKTNAPVKSIASLKGKTHLEPMNETPGDTEGPYVGSFFRCWLYRDMNACNSVYGQDSSDLCKEYPMFDCQNTYKKGERSGIMV